MDTTPRIADSDNNLLYKICAELSARNGGAYPPRIADSDNNLLRKIALLEQSSSTSVAALEAQLAALEGTLGDDLFEVWNFDNSPTGSHAGYTFQFNIPDPVYADGYRNSGLTMDNSHLASVPGTSIFDTSKSFTVASWVKAGASGNFETFFTISPDQQHFNQLGGVSDMTGVNFRFRIMHAGVIRSRQFLSATYSGKWTLLLFGYDQTTDVMFSRVNNDAVVESVPFGVSPATVTGDIYTNTGGGTNIAGNAVTHDVLTCWNRRLTLAEMDAFWWGRYTF